MHGAADDMTHIARSPQMCQLLPYTTLFRSWRVRTLPELAPLSERAKTLLTQACVAAAPRSWRMQLAAIAAVAAVLAGFLARSEEHTSELQSRLHLVCRLLLEKQQQQRTVLH